MATSTIDQANVEITFADVLDLNRESGRLEYFVTQRLAYVVEREISSLELPEGAELAIEELQLDLGDASVGNYQTLFESRLTARLRDALQACIKKIQPSAASRIDIKPPVNATLQSAVLKQINKVPVPGDKLDVTPLKLFLSRAECGEKITEQEIRRFKELLPQILKNATPKVKTRLLSEMSRAGFESLHKYYSIAELELLVYTAAPELRYVLSQQSNPTHNATEYKSVLLNLLACQNGEVPETALVSQTRASDAMDLTVPDQYRSFIDSPAEGSFSRAYSMLERLFAVSPQGFYQASRTAVYAQLSNAKPLPEEILNSVREQYRQSVTGVDKKVLAGRLMQRATLSELKSVCALLLNSRDDHLKSVLWRLAEETGRADLVWSLAIIFIVRGEPVDITQVRSMCYSLQSEFPDQTGKRFSWFLSAEFGESASKPEPSERTIGLESLLSALFTLSSTVQESALRQQLTQWLSVPEQGTKLTTILPAEFQVAVLQFVQGRKDWRMVNGSFLAMDQPSRLTAAKDTGESWQHGLMDIDFESNSGHSLTTILTQEKPGSKSRQLTAAVTSPEQAIRKNQVSDNSAGADNTNDSRNITAHKKPQLAEASYSKQHIVNQLTDAQTLARLIACLPESKLAQIAEQKFGEVFKRRHEDIELICGILNSLLSNTVRSHPAQTGYHFCIGKAVKWSYLLGGAVKADAGTSGTPVHGKDINEGFDQRAVSSRGKLTLSGTDNSLDKVLQSLIDAALIQFVREVEQHSLKGEITFDEQIYAIDNNNHLHWGKHKIRSAIDEYSASRNSTDNARLHRLKSMEQIIEEFSDVPELLLPEQPTPFIEMAVNDEVPVDNAGLILTASLLARLFEMHQLLEDNVFKSQADRKLGVQLLNFISYGEETVGHVQPLSNVLCGEDVMAPFEPVVPLTLQQKESVNSMLQSIIQHWDIGNTSVDGLRASFIYRDGMLQKVDQGWKLTVEPDAFDVLLDRLPWNYELVKLQWMEEPVHVTWRK